MYPVFDLHCDTALEMYRRQSGFLHNGCHVNATLAKTFAGYGQVAAVFTPHGLSDEEGWQQCFAVLSYLRTHLDGCAVIATDSQQVTSAWDRRQNCLIPAVEDARILAGKPERLEVLYREGVRILTLLWSGNTCIGGSHDTSEGLTPFGEQTVRNCLTTGIIPDVSHASSQSTDEIISLSEQYGKPCIASHSDSYRVHPHSRNLRDRHFLAIKRSGGLVGLNLCPDHLGSRSYEAVLRHAEHYLSLGGENTLCLGCDLDGSDLPDGIANLADLTRIADLFARNGYSEELIRHIFYSNALNFFQKNLNNESHIS